MLVFLVQVVVCTVGVPVHYEVELVPLVLLGPQAKVSLATRLVDLSVVVVAESEEQRSFVSAELDESPAILHVEVFLVYVEFEELHVARLCLRVIGLALETQVLRPADWKLDDQTVIIVIELLSCLLGKGDCSLLATLHLFAVLGHLVAARLNQSPVSDRSLEDLALISVGLNGI